MVTHYFFSCSARRSARLIAGWGAPVWLYVFDYKMDFALSALLGDYHSSELDFGAPPRARGCRAQLHTPPPSPPVWGNPWPLNTFTPSDYNMSAVRGVATRRERWARTCALLAHARLAPQTFMRYWTNLARFGTCVGGAASACAAVVMRVYTPYCDHAGQMMRRSP